MPPSVPTYAKQSMFYFSSNGMKGFFSPFQICSILLKNIWGKYLGSYLLGVDFEEKRRRVSFLESKAVVMFCVQCNIETLWSRQKNMSVLYFGVFQRGKKQPLAFAAEWSVLRALNMTHNTITHWLCPR